MILELSYTTTDKQLITRLFYSINSLQYFLFGFNKVLPVQPPYKHWTHLNPGEVSHIDQTECWGPNQYLKIYRRK